MTVDLLKELNIGSAEDNNIVDLDLIAVKMETLAAEVESYRASIVRHINARRDLLGESDPLNNGHSSIQQLLEIRDKLNQDFRERFRVSGGIFTQPDSTNNSPGQSRFYTSGR